MRLFRILAIAIFWFLPVQAVAELRLVMVEEAGCVWCARWNAEIAPIYPRTPEGRAAPLLRIDRLRPLPAGLELSKAVRYTPTFILVEDGREMNRIEGYPGEDFFWGMLEQMIRQLESSKPMH